MARYDITGFRVACDQALLPNKLRDVPRVEDRRVLDGIFWILRSGSPWRDLPRTLRPLYHRLQPLQSLAESRRVGQAHGRYCRGPSTPWCR